MSRWDGTDLELRELIAAYCDEVATTEQIKRLESLLDDDAPGQRLLLDALQVDADLHLLVGGNDALAKALSALDSGASRKGLSKESPAAAAAPPVSPVLGFLGNITHLGSSFTPTVWVVLMMISAATLLGVVLNIAVCVLGVRFEGPRVVENAPLPLDEGRRLDTGDGKKGDMVEPSLPPRRRVANPIARLAQAVECAWAGDAERLEAGDDLAAGQELALESGLAEIVFAGGARTILQGPAKFVVRSRTTAFLDRGKCTVTVENAQSKGFEIDTRGMKYTDLGTEFGVLVAKTGEQEVHVFRGRVQAVQDAEKGRGGEGEIAMSPNPRVPPSPIILAAHQAIRVAAPDASGKPVKPIERIAANAQEFVRAMPLTPLDLADIVAGGDGTSGRTGRGLDPLTGNVTDVMGLEVLGTPDYRKVTALKFIDGVFVPHGGAGPVQLDSAGHRYALPNTCGRTDHAIIARTAKPLQGTMPNAGNALADSLAHVLDRAHPQLYLHANVGVTFALDAIRAGQAERKPTHFQAVLSTEPSGQPTAAMSAWVFVDGQLCFQKQKFHLRDGYFGIDVPLPAGARFLTLVATDAGVNITSDHVLFHSPQLVMEAAK